MNRGSLIEELPGPKARVIQPTPLPPVDPSNLALLPRAQAALQNPDSSSATILKFNKDVLRQLCHERNIFYPGKSQKVDLVEMLFTDVSCVSYEPFGMSDRPLSSAGLSSVLMVLGKREA